jgi:purine-cytosine permease-like protein
LSAATFALAYGGRHVLETIINNLLSMLGYWTLAFATIIFIEHFWFRPRLGGYDLSAWQDQKRMPWGLAGTASLLIGIGFSFLGMAQTWVSDSGSSFYSLAYCDYSILHRRLRRLGYLVATWVMN